MSSLFQQLAQSLPQQQLEQQQSAFLQEGLDERAFLQVENERLKASCAALLRSRRVQALVHPFADHSSRTEAELLVKYHQTLSEIDYLRVDIAALQARADQEQLVLKTQLSEVEEQLEEARVSFYLLRTAALDLYVRAFGVFLTYEQAANLEHDFQAELEHAAQAKLAELEASEELKTQLAGRAYAGPAARVKIIDYEQVKIENQNLAEKIEERSEELLKLRRRTVSTLQILAHVREKRHFVTYYVAQLEREKAALDDMVSYLRYKSNALKTERTKKRREAEESRDQTGLSGNQVLVQDYARRTAHVEQLHNQMAELRRQQQELQGQWDELEKAISRKKNGQEW